MTIKRKLKHMSDPAHGWLSVSIKDLKSLGIENEISEYSYTKGNRVYLEEDRDASIFMKRARENGWDIEITESHTDKKHWIRYQEKYKPNKKDIMITKKDLSSYCKKYKLPINLIWNQFKKVNPKFNEKSNCYSFKDETGTLIKICCDNYPKNYNVTFVGIKGVNI